MSKILQTMLSVGSGLSGRHDNDLTDRLVGRYTSSLFVALCVVVTSTSYVGEPIHCWCPAQFTPSHARYANAHCLVSATYIAPFREVLPQRPAPERHINYYVWVPLILLCQACLCAVPGVIWRNCYRSVGVNVPALVDRLNSAGHSLGWEHRDKAVEYVIHHMRRYAEGYRPVRCKGPGATCCCISKSSGNYLTFCYLITKLLYFIVSFGQFVGLNWFLGFDFIFFGFDTVQQVLTDGAAWITIERFPKVTMCEFSVRHMNKVHTWVLQCVLPINIFNERVFLLVWFWLLGLSFLTLISFCKWTCKSIIWRPQIKHVKSQLRFKHSSRPRDFKTAVIDFVTDYLRRDSMTVLRMMSHNAGSLMEEEVLMGLWNNFYRPKTAAPSCPDIEVYCPTVQHNNNRGNNRDNNRNSNRMMLEEHEGDYCPATLGEVVAEVDMMVPP